MAPSALPGTILNDPDFDMADGFGNNPMFASNAAHTPRVVQYHEVLPWAPGRSLQEAYRPGSRTLTADAEGRPSHPMHSIGADFIARALGRESLAGSRMEADSDDHERSRDVMPWENWW
jgi:hypothetical protein